jgi:hypothetical protein
MTPATRFEIGDRVVHAIHGAGRVSDRVGDYSGYLVKWDRKGVQRHWSSPEVLRREGQA